MRNVHSPLTFKACLIATALLVGGVTPRAEGVLTVTVNNFRPIVDNQPGWDRSPTDNQITIDTSQAPWPANLGFLIRGTFREESAGAGYRINAHPLDVGDISGGGAGGTLLFTGLFANVGVAPFPGWYAWSNATGSFDDWIPNGVPYIDNVGFTASGMVHDVSDGWAALPEMQAQAQDRFPQVPFLVGKEADGRSTADGAGVTMTWFAGPWDVIRFPLDVSVIAPEPGCLSLLALGVMGFLGRRVARR